MVLPYANLGGTERHVWFLARELARRGRPVTVVLPDGPARALFDQAGIRTIPIPAPALGSFGRIVATLRQSVPEKAIVHVHAAMELVWAARIAAPAATRVYTCHGFHARLDYRKAGMFLNSTGAEVIAVSEPEREKLLAGRLVADRCHVIPGAVDIEGLLAPGADLPDRLTLVAGQPLIGTVARLDRHKGIDRLVSAMPAVLARHRRAVLAVAGDGPERSRLERLATRLGIAGSVRWLGRVEDPGPVLRALDVFALPTQAESFGMAPLEAMACSVPVVVTALPALRQMVRDGVDGVLLPPADGPDRWGVALSDLLAAPDRLREMGQAAALRARDFSLEALCDRTLEIYALAARRS